MNEIYIYKKIKYKRILKSASEIFENKKRYIVHKTIFAEKHNTYSVSINKNSIRICYWNEFSEDGINAKNIITKFLTDNFSGETLIVTKNGTCDIFDNLKNINIIQIMWGNKWWVY